MSIVKLEFLDIISGWHLQNTAFANLNLLVGISGVGKTKVLRSIRSIGNLARGYTDVHDCKWTIAVRAANGQVYTWDAIVGKKTQLTEDGEPEHWPLIVEERISLNGETFINRSNNVIHFEGNPLPNLKDSESVVSLFRSDATISPLYETLSRVRYSVVIARQDHFRGGFLQNGEAGSIEALRNNVELSLLDRAQLLQTHFTNYFDQVVESFKEIFPSVTDVNIGEVADFDSDFDYEPAHRLDSLTIGIREAEGQWIYGSHISSGMLRTFLQLLELELSPADSVFLIDEIENSLGLNCLGPVIDHIKSRGQDLQFIMTSHHPYIINNISVDDWRIVTRKGSTVTVKNASDIPALSGQSRQEKFMRLINAPEFEEGIQ